jgi:hypothetical protein
MLQESMVYADVPNLTARIRQAESVSDQDTMNILFFIINSARNVFVRSFSKSSYFTAFAAFALTVVGAFPLVASAIENACLPLAVGEARLFNGYVGSPVYAYFTLVRREDRRISPGTSVPSHEALVNIQFVDEQGNIDQREAAKYERKTQKCFDIIASKLRGPNGEFIGIGLSKNYPELPQPKEMRVAVVHKWFFRSNSAEWKARPNCPLIIHETLHLLGLVDEYRERKLKNTGNMNGEKVKLLKYDCRSLGPSNSIMSNQGKAFRGSGLDWFSKAIGRDGRPSLLYAGQYYALLQPGCILRNATYYACARDAYETSSAHMGKGCAVDKPSVCSKPSWVKIFDEIPLVDDNGKT